MNRYKYFNIILALFIILLSVNISEAVTVLPQQTAEVNVTVEGNEPDTEENDVIKRISLKGKFKKSPENQIKDFFKKYNKYSAKDRIDKLKDLYTEDYVNNDGFDKKTFFKMVDMAKDAYKDISYSAEIEDIKINGNNAVVRLHEQATGETNQKIMQVNDNGKITSDSYYTHYLRKEGNKWLINASIIDSEELSLTYGEAKNMTVSVSAPECVASGSEYEIEMKTNTPDGVMVLGSIVNEPIIFPQKQNKDVFRSIKDEALSRIVRANKDNHNEYATISIALTRAMIEPPAVLINMTGIAFVMKRINVISKNEVK